MAHKRSGPRIAWHQANHYKQNKSAFAKVPIIFGTRSRTQIILALAMNGPSLNRELIHAVNGSYRAMIQLVRRLEAIDVVCSGDRYRTAHWLNTAHPCYRQFRAIARIVDERWPIPRWKKYRRPNVPPDRIPQRPPCTLFWKEPMTRSLLYITARGKVGSSEIAEILAYATNYEAKYGLRRLTRDGIIRSAKRLHANAPMDYHLNASYFAAKPMRTLLQNLLTLYPDIRRQAELAEKYRFNRLLIKNRKKPHLKGLLRYHS